MASSIDTVINQHIQSFKANLPLLIPRSGPPNHASPGIPSWTAPGPGAPVPPHPMSTLAGPGAQPPAGAGGTGTSLAMLSVAIDNLSFRYQLAEADLRETFQRWGALQSVQVNRDGAREVGVVHFADRIDASDAQRQLNGHVCGFDGASGTLAVVLGGPEQLSPPLMRPSHFMPGQTLPHASMSGPAPPLGQGPPGGPQQHGLPGGLPHGGRLPAMAGMPPGGMPPNIQLGAIGPPPTASPLGMSLPPGTLPSAPGPQGAMPKSAPTSLAMGVGGGLPTGMVLGKGEGLLAGKGDGLLMPGKGEIALAATKGGDGKGDRGLLPGKGGKGAGWPGLVNGWDANANGRPAWSCKIIVHAETLHPEFPTVTKIVGVNGQNVEHICTQTGCTVQLRGAGSGHLEPESGQELQEPMFAWLSSDSPQSGKNALEMFQDLLKSVFEEHQSWCQQHNLMQPSFMDPTVIENPDGPGVPVAGALPLVTAGGGPQGPAAGELFRPQHDPSEWGRGYHGKGPY